MCGLWALWSPSRCLSKACDDRYERLTAMGLVALHGDEGFRAERGRVICLFEDWVWRPREPMEQPQGLVQRLVSLLRGHDQPPEPDPDRPIELARAAERYSVPLVTLREAVRVGLLSELGVSRAVIEEVRDWVANA
jgi:hypothetical protein